MITPVVGKIQNCACCRQNMIASITGKIRCSTCRRYEIKYNNAVGKIGLIVVWQNFYIILAFISCIALFLTYCKIFGILVSNWYIIMPR